MKILLRETVIEQDDGTDITRIIALYPEDGTSMCQIPAMLSYIWCDNDELSTEYNHAEGIYWNTWEEARFQLAEHEICMD